MENINNVLFATDFSVTSDTAFSFALEIVGKLECKLTLLHVYEVPNIAPANVFTSLEDTISIVSEEMEAVSNEKLKFLQQQATASGVTCEICTRQGNVTEEITKMIEGKTDLIVMGTQGRNADRGLFVGSTADAIIKSSICPVFCVPVQASMKKINKIAYATDLRYDETEIVGFIVGLAKALDAEVIILHIDKKVENKDWSIEMLQELVDKTAYKKVFFREIVANNIFDGIDSFMKNYAVDVVSATTSNTSFFDRLMHKSHTKEILMQTEIPLLAFNRKKHDTIFLG